MGLDSIWDEEGNYLTKESKGFRARSTGCSCCSCELETEEKVRKEAVDSLSFILIAADFFKWDMSEIITEARNEVKPNSSHD